MFASSHGPHSAARRRGIVLVLVLGMLGLMALIGVTFAAFAGQSLKSGRSYAQGLQRPQPEALMDFALAQLINDTNNPLSALRGHSLLRDMYGNDSVFRGATPPNNTVADTGGLMTVVNTTSGVSTLHLGVGKPRGGVSPNTVATPFYNNLQYQTNIPLGGPYQGYDFTRWIIRFPARASTVAQTFEILEDDFSNYYQDGVHHFTLSNALGNPTSDLAFSGQLTSSDTQSFIYNDPNLGAGIGSNAVAKSYTALNREHSNGTISFPFILDGRFMRAFNGPGLTRPVAAVPITDANGVTNYVNYPFNQAAYGNMRVAGYDPDTIGMDEDYDACDLENWFLAIQSADGQVMIPSFHRPGILTANDWSATAHQTQRAKILRPRQADNSPLFPTDPSIVDPTSGRLTYDIDNDGDGVTDSVWLDLGYPATRDPNGKLYKPLFAFMVLGLNGRLPLNTVGNLQARAIGDVTNNVPESVSFPNSTGQVPYPGIYDPTASASGLHNPYYSSQVFFDQPLFDHASHLGYSVNEINPKFALQNAPSNLYGSYDGSFTATALGTYSQPNATSTGLAYAAYTQYDDAGVSVALTQLRNLLSGTLPTDLPNPYPASTATPLPVSSSYGSYRTGGVKYNNDMNVVAVDGKPFILPNNMADSGDYVAPNATAVERNMEVAQGRWGEPGALTYNLPFPSVPTSDPTYPALVYLKGAGPGRSTYTSGTIDPMDDDFDGFDPVLASALERQPITIQTTSSTSNSQIIPLHPAIAPYTDTAQYPAYPVTASFARVYPEDFDTFDGAGQMTIAAERARRFVTPQDTVGIGRQVAYAGGMYQSRPLSENDFGFGSDRKGRIAHFRYFRPAGLPQEVVYPYYDSGAAAYTDAMGVEHAASGSGFYNGTYVTNSGTGQRYLMPVYLPAGRSAASDAMKFQLVSTPDVTNNRLHGYQAALTPQIAAAGANYLAAMPYDWDPWLAVNDPDGVGTPPGFNDVVMDINKTSTGAMTKGLKIQLYSPTINPNTPYTNSTVNSSSGPNIGPDGDPGGTIFPLPWGGYTQFTIPDSAGNDVKDKDSNVINFERALNAPVVNSYFGGSLNKDEADEMNLYTVNSFDAPFGPSDLEWLYRKQDVDGSLLSSRLAELAPVSFLNPADGQTRRRLFSTDSWDLINFSYANDNPQPYAGILGGNGLKFVTRTRSADHDFTYNSRFGSDASPSLEIMNQVVSVTPSASQFAQFANPVTTEFLPNPTLPTQTGAGDSFTTYRSNSGSSFTDLPLAIDPTNPNGVAGTAAAYNMFGAAFANSQANQYTNVIVPVATQVQTPSVAHRDRKINLNYPLPISNDPAEPIRQKWCRETYQMLKAILPPAAVDTPEELAALSQYVVNIIDFRDPDCSMTRFVNTDLVVTDVLTKKASISQVPEKFDTTWTVSPAGVRFAGAADIIAAPHFPYDPSLYSPDTSPNCHYLVQHGMEYSPIAINEAMAYSANYSKDFTQPPVPYAAMFIELVNTLTESRNNPKSNYSAMATLASTGNNHNIPNSSAISLAGWDIVVLPDNYGWGRPDPISGDVNPVAVPVYTPNPTGDTALPPAATQWVHTTTTDTNWTQLKAAVAQYAIPTSTAAGTPTPGSFVKAISGESVDYYIIGDYRDVPPGGPQTRIPDQSKIESDPVATKSQINLQLPTSFTIPVAPKSQGMYYWVYLRRPANPFDIDTPNQVRPNKEMVVVDAMRFPVINATTGSYTPSADGTKPPTAFVKDPNQIYSAQRLQPYRGGHLVAQRTNPLIPKPDSGPDLITTLPKDGSDSSKNAGGVTTICPPSPPYAYGYSEQMADPPGGKGFASVQITGTDGKVTNNALSQNFRQSINDPNANLDTNWAHFPFHDRDFNNVAELLLVPGCPPGLFTKQFVEEPYPGNIFDKTNATAVGTDNGTRAFAFTTASKPGDGDSSPQSAPAAGVTTGPNVIVAPSVNYDPSQVARKDFFMTAPATPTFPYLTDNFYYTAASVTPPIGGSLNASYTKLTTEIGGWTGAGWHKMLEFFEVPSSANGAIGPAASGDNYDWARNDLKPGLLNLNLIIDEEVFAGLLDDPRLNENLAALNYGSFATTIPYVVNQIDFTGFPAYTVDGAGAVTIVGETPMFIDSSVNDDNVTTASLTSPAFITESGRGYVTRDPIAQHYGTVPPPQLKQVHGIKAAFSDFLKLAHGGSGYLFAHGAGDVGMGSFQQRIGLTSPLVTSPIAAARPYRSLSYPDINYTIMRPASLPPAPADSSGTLSTGQYITSGTNPFLPYALVDLFSYNANAYPTSPTNGDKAPTPFLQLFAGNGRDIDPSTSNTPLAPMNTASAPSGTKYQYIQDPGIKNPYLAVQYANPGTPIATSDLLKRALAPPYDAMLGPYTEPATPIAAPFPPPIPPTPARRLFQIPDAVVTSNASYLGGFNQAAFGLDESRGFAVNQPVSLPALSNGQITGLPTTYPPPPTLVLDTRVAFGADNNVPVMTPNLNNYLGAGFAPNASATPDVNDYRQHPVYRTEMIQKISNLTTVRTHQFATWITVGFFEVVATGTPELGLPDTLGGEIGTGAGDRIRYRAFFVIDRTKATGFNPYYPGNFRDCVTYRRRIE